MNLKGLKEFLDQCKRVLRVSKKPDIEEFKTVAKVTGLGMILLGFIGVLVYLIFRVLRGGI